MADAVVRGLLPDNLRVSLVVATETAREARARHRLAPVSAALLAQGLAGGALMASLQKGDGRVNLQLECDGPLKGFFVDAGAGGDLRGYVKNPLLDVELGQGPFRWRAALGNSGFLSVLRDLGADYYRSSVELVAMDVGRDLDHFFGTSEQVPTHLAIDVKAEAGEPLGLVGGVLVQAIPEEASAPGPGEAAATGRKALEALGPSLSARLAEALAEAGAVAGGAAGLARRLFPEVQLVHEGPLAFRCSCSRERALNTVAALGKAEIQHIVDTMGSTAVTCHFCGAKHEISLADLLGLLDRLGVERPRS